MAVMRYSPAANLVNVLFIGTVFLAPISYCLTHPSIPADIGRAVILLSFALGAFAIGDWYHFYLSNSGGGISLGIILGAITAFVGVAIASASTAHSIGDLAFFQTTEGWAAQRFLLRLYVAGVGVLAVAVLGVPRLAVLRLVTSQPLPRRPGA